MEFCKSIIEQYEPCKEARELNHMTVDGKLIIHLKTNVKFSIRLFLEFLVIF